MTKKIIVVLVSIVLIAVCMVVNNIKQDELEKEHKELVSEYVTCLKEHNTQRSYCANELGTDYMLLDQLLDDYGYEYVSKGLDLYVVEK